MVVFCRLRLRSSSFGVYKWVPMPTSKPGYQDYALLYPFQLIRVQEWLRKYQDSLIHPDELVIELTDIMNLSGTPISYPTLWGILSWQQHPQLHCCLRQSRSESRNCWGNEDESQSLVYVLEFQLQRL